MNGASSALRHMLRVGLPWAILWLVFWAIVLGIIAIVDPESIDPGEGPMVAVILGPMGLLSGLAVGVILSNAARGRSPRDLSLIRVVGWGMLGCAIVQPAYLGHGDQGLVANIKMALLFCAFGGVVTMAWLVMARTWAHWRPSPQPSA